MSVNYNSVFLKRETDDIKNFIDSFYLINPYNTEAEFDKFIEYRNVQSNIINNLQILTINEYFWRNINDKSVVLNVLITNKKEKNINISLILEKTNVFKAALIVYILVE